MISTEAQLHLHYGRRDSVSIRKSKSLNTGRHLRTYPTSVRSLVIRCALMGKVGAQSQPLDSATHAEYRHEAELDLGSTGI